MRLQGNPVLGPSEVRGVGICEFGVCWALAPAPPGISLRPLTHDPAEVSGPGRGVGGSENDSANLHTCGARAHAYLCACMLGSRTQELVSQAPGRSPLPPRLITCLPRGHSFLAQPGLQPGRTEGAATCPKPEWARGRMAARGWLPKKQGVGGVERMSPGQPQTTCPSMLCVPECSTSELAFPSMSSGHTCQSLTEEEGRGQGLGRGCPRPANETGKTSTEVPGQWVPPRQVSPGEPS